MDFSTWCSPKAKSGLFLASSLCDGIEDNNLKQVASLLRNNEADPNVLIPLHGITPFHLVVGNESETFAIEVTKLFLRHGGNPNIKSVDGMTPVHVAAAWGRINILELLLANGGDPLQLDDEDCSPFHYAFQGKHYETIALLSNYCIDSTLDDEEKPKYKRELDKVIVNTGNLQAEYFVSEDSALDSSLNHSSSLASNLFSDTGIHTDSKENNSSFQNTDFVTLRRHQVRKNLINHRYKTKLDKKRNDAKKISLEEIISYLSASAINTSDDGDPRLNSSKRREISLTFIRPRRKKRNKMSRLKIPSKNQTQNGLQTPSRLSLHNLPIFDETIISKSPNIFIESKRKTEGHETTARCKFMKKSYLYPSSCTDSFTETNTNCDESSIHESSLNLCEKMNSMKIETPVDNSEMNEMSNDSLECVNGSVLHPKCSENETADDIIFHKPENDFDTTDLMKRIGSDTLVSVEQEYKYEDPEEGVALVERRFCVTPSAASSEASFYSCTTTKSEPLPTEILRLDQATLRNRLTDLGEKPGPITLTTRHLYLKRLHKLQTENSKLFQTMNPEDNLLQNGVKCISPTILSVDWLRDLKVYEAVEEKVFNEFVSPDPTRRWREGTTKASFNYILLDPRITRDLPRRTAGLDVEEQWTTFLSSIFYVGKGKRTRPYAHLYDAFKTWVSKDQSANPKIQRILDIWNDGRGVIALHVFQNTIPVEAYTREAVMIEALTTKKLSNCKAGDFYGVVSTWRSKEKCELGRYLLYKAMQILMVEGERQIFPDNL